MVIYIVSTAIDQKRKVNRMPLGDANLAFLLELNV